jgi:TetR/AcrR family acrAB operon transcriptional repressor
MARKTKEDAEHTYAALLEAAEQMFFDKGVAHTTLNDIAAAAGMTRGAIYWHFKDKGALLQALLEQAMLPMEAILSEVGKCCIQDPLGTVREVCIHSLCSLAQSPKQQRVFDIFFNKCENTGEIADLMQRESACRDECKQRFKSMLEEAITQGQLPADLDIALAQQILNNFIVGTMREWLLEPQSYDLEKAAPTMVDVLLAGLKACPPRLPAG